MKQELYMRTPFNANGEEDPFALQPCSPRHCYRTQYSPTMKQTYGSSVYEISPLCIKQHILKETSPTTISSTTHNGEEYREPSAPRHTPVAIRPINGPIGDEKGATIGERKEQQYKIQKVLQSVADHMSAQQIIQTEQLFQNLTISVLQ